MNNYIKGLQLTSFKDRKHSRKELRKTYFTIKRKPPQSLLFTAISITQFSHVFYISTLTHSSLGTHGKISKGLSQCPTQTRAF